ncbi:hypothetical protein BuS5_01547 [Desulfosarcina sp. BuS5]|uniref:hypothetical protein n=1 Tax=Desulfosarcina sp. BuS5 TaxID=933262 RepID=UPI000488305E|nr:hypothetical protein [Desulfosarcina sp. BuS5]WDN88579.1 hypothetical protein BuS5_01547 [Desulfosarcina sp. BuS5]
MAEINASGVLQALCMLSWLASANLDIRSFRLNFELSTFVHSTGLNRDIEAWLDRLLSDAAEVVADDFKQLPPGTRLVNAAAHLLSPLF